MRVGVAVDVDVAVGVDVLVAVAGLLAQTGRTLRQAEHTALTTLARTTRDDLETELLSVDRVGALVDKAAQTAPLLVRETVPKLVTLPRLTELLRTNS